MTGKNGFGQPAAGCRKNPSHITNYNGSVLVSDIAIFVLKRDVKLQLTGQYTVGGVMFFSTIIIASDRRSEVTICEIDSVRSCYRLL